VEPKEVPFNQSGLASQVKGANNANPNQEKISKEAGQGYDPYHQASDVDSSHLALHHRIGLGDNQVNAGTHNHDGVNSREIAGLAELSENYYAHNHENGPQNVPNFTNQNRNIYFPSWIGSTGNPGLGNGTLNGDWIRFGNIAFLTFWLQFGTTTGTGSGFYSFGNLPIAPSLVGAKNMLHGMIYNNASRWPVAAVIENNRIDRIIVADDKAGGTPLLGGAGWKTGWVAGDYIYLSGFYWV
jgi:hypothetical protein